MLPVGFDSCKERLWLRTWLRPCSLTFGAKGQAYPAGISFVGISLNGIPSLKAGISLRGEFFLSGLSGFVVVVGCRRLFLPRCGWESNRKFPRIGKFPSTSQVPWEIFLRRGKLFKPDDPNQVVRFKEIPTKQKFPLDKIGPNCTECQIASAPGRSLWSLS